MLIRNLIIKWEANEDFETLSREINVSSIDLVVSIKDCQFSLSHENAIIRVIITTELFIS